MRVEVKSIVDQKDGSSIAEFEMDLPALKVFAQIGLLQSIKDQTFRFIEEQNLPSRTKKVSTKKPKLCKTYKKRKTA